MRNSETIDGDLEVDFWKRETRGGRLNRLLYNEQWRDGGREVFLINHNTPKRYSFHYNYFSIFLFDCLKKLLCLGITGRSPPGPDNPSELAR